MGRERDTPANSTEWSVLGNSARSGMVMRFCACEGSVVVTCLSHASRAHSHKISEEGGIKCSIAV